MNSERRDQPSDHGEFIERIKNEFLAGNPDVKDTIRKLIADHGLEGLQLPRSIISDNKAGASNDRGASGGSGGDEFLSGIDPLSSGQSNEIMRRNLEGGALQDVSNI